MGSFGILTKNDGSVSSDQGKSHAKSNWVLKYMCGDKHFHEQ